MADNYKTAPQLGQHWSAGITGKSTFGLPMTILRAQRHHAALKRLRHSRNMHKRRADHQLGPCPASRNGMRAGFSLGKSSVHLPVRDNKLEHKCLTPVAYYGNSLKLARYKEEIFMLKFMRHAGQTKIAKGLFIILLGSFAIWGIGPIFRGGGRVHTAAQAGHVKISTTEADQAFQQQVRGFERQYGFPLNPQMIAQLGFKQQVLQQLVMQSLYDQEASKLGLRLGTDLVRQTIAAQPNFRDEEGRFNPKRFQEFLRQIGMNEAGYVQTLKGDIVRLLLMGSVKGSAQPSDTLTRTYYEWQNEQRVVDSVEIRAADMTGVPQPTNEDLQKYLTDNSSQFMAPEYRGLTYAVLDLKKISAAIQVSDADIKAAFDAAPDSFGTPETRDIVQITTQDENLAKQIATEAAGKPLEDVAKAHNIIARPVAGISRSNTLPELATAIFALEQGKPSEAIHSSMGWHVIVVTKSTPAVTKTLEQAKNEISASIQLQKGQEQLYDITKKLQDTLAGGTTLPDAAKQLGLDVITVEETSHDGFKPDGSQITGQPLLRQVLASSFDQPQGQVGQVQETGAGAFVAVVDNVIPSHVKPLAEVKSEVQTAWLNAKRMELAVAKATEQAEKLRQGESLRSMASSQPLKRDGSNRDKLPEASINHIFASKVGDVLTAEANDGVWIIKLTAIKPAQMERADLAPVRTELKQQMANDILQQFGNALRSSYGVTLNDAWLQQTADAE